MTKFLSLFFVIFLVAAEVQANPQNTSREKVRFGQSLEPDSKIRLKESGLSAKSKHFVREVKASELNQGIDIVTAGDNAVIQLSALKKIKGNNKSAVSDLPEDLSILKNGSARNLKDAVKQQSAAARYQSPELYQNTQLTQLPKEIGHGRFKLKSNKRVADDNRYMLYVLDKNSDMELELKCAHRSFAAGKKLQAEAQLVDSKGMLAAEYETVLKAPDGRTFKVPHSIKNKKLSVNWPLNINAERTPGALWELEVRAKHKKSADENVERVANLALDIFPASAELIQVQANTNAMSLQLKVEQAGRFEARVLVYGTDSDDTQKPIFLNYHAEWLEAGKQNWEIEIDQQSLANSVLNGPYIVKEIQVLDQTRMSVISTANGDWAL